MTDLLRFIASPAGRLIRVAVGVSLLAAGLAQGRKGWGLATVGLLPLSMGAFDLCLLSPLQGLPFNGPKAARGAWARARIGRPTSLPMTGVAR